VVICGEEEGKGIGYRGGGRGDRVGRMLSNDGEIKCL